MPRGDKSKYTDKQKRKAEHIAEGYEERGVSEKEAEARAWATVNKESGGGKKSGSGRGKKESHASSHKGGKKGGAASASRSAAERSASAENDRGPVRRGPRNPSEVASPSPHFTAALQTKCFNHSPLASGGATW